MYERTIDAQGTKDLTAVLQIIQSRQIEPGILRHNTDLPFRSIQLLLKIQDLLQEGLIILMTSYRDNKTRRPSSSSQELLKGLFYVITSHER